MEVVPTSDGEEDDGVIWFRCPQCQGFLPKLSGSDSGPDSGSERASESDSDSKRDTSPVEPGSSPQTSSDDSLPWDSPADMMADRDKPVDGEAFPGPVSADPLETPDKQVMEDEDEPTYKRGKKKEGAEPAQPTEPIHEYIALLAEKDQGNPTPYRPWETYEVGQCILHQAWEDCGVVVAKETLPGGREVIKCFFAEAGVVRLIEKAPR